MSEPLPSTPQAGPPVRQKLQELARLLRGARHLSPHVQQELADLLEGLAGELESAPHSDHTEHLAESAAHVAEELHERGDEGPLAATKHRLVEAAARAESKAPVATGLARRLVALLSDIGI